MAEEKKLMRISELADATGVSIQSIHYYLREGLLPPPTKTARNMAYYSPEYVEDIKLIKELQEKRYLPLAVIKLVLTAKREGKDLSQLQDMRLNLEGIFRPLGQEEGLNPMTQREMVSATGLAAETLETLEEMGLLMPLVAADGKQYDGLDTHVARTVKKLLDLGLVPADLRFYGQYVSALQTEAKVIREKIIHRPEGKPPVTGSEIKEMLDNLKSSLMAKVYRRAALEFHQEEVDNHKSN